VEDILFRGNENLLTIFLHLYNSKSNEEYYSFLVFGETLRPILFKFVNNNHFKIAHFLSESTHALQQLPIQNMIEKLKT
jgi:hypothetical protein